MQKKLAVVLAVLAVLPVAVSAQPQLTDYLPPGVAYDPEVPTPASVLGWEVGDWHVRHDQLVAYMRALAAHSDRVAIEVTGKTYEERPLLLLTISSPRNLARLDAIRDEHLRLGDPAAPRPDTAGMPVVVYLGYSVHGNEASGANASLLVAYHLAAARGEEIEELLASAVILLDPSLNPDGLARFAQWANMHRGRVLVGDPRHREHVEGWPNGRTNHYWFDLNRDWLPLVHPESRARLATFHRWKPNLLTDFHEMGSNQTFFFQPGIPVRQNPLTPQRNLELTREIAGYHAAALDAIGSLYFTEEVFDDFYYGKGSTYPDVNGAVGILFEQGSARGHVQETINGDLRFPFAIRNQFTTSLSTLRAALDKRRDLLAYQADFYRDGAGEKEVGAYVVGEPDDAVRAHLFVDLLRRHAVRVHALARPVERGGVRYEPGSAWAVPLAQPQRRLIRAMFEKPVSFADSTFYDVSAWTLPLAFGLPFDALDRDAFEPGLLGEEVGEPAPPRGRFVSGDGRVVAYAFAWDGYFAPRALYRLLAAEVRARVAVEPFTAETAEGPRGFGYGTIVVPLGIQDAGADVGALLRAAADEDAVDVFALTTGLTPEGIDVGSPSLRPLALPEAAIVVGDGVSPYEVGEIWHLLDQRFHVPVTLLERSLLKSADLGEYSHLIFVDGDYGDAPPELRERLRGWVRRGGVLVATQGAAVAARGLLREGDSEAEGAAKAQTGAEEKQEEKEQEKEEETPQRLPYAEHRQRREAEMISGAIFAAELDVTHPLAYGYRRASLPVFRSSTLVLEPQTNPYVTVVRYAEEPLLAGYVSEANLRKLKGGPAVVAERLGGGLVVRMVDDPNFRGFWYGTNKLFLNALFFGSVVEATPAPR